MAGAADGQKDKLKKWMNTEIEDVSSSSHGGSGEEVAEQRSRQRSESGRKIQEGLGLEQAPVKTQMEKPKTDSEGGSSKSSKSISLYQMYNT